MGVLIDIFSHASSKVDNLQYYGGSMLEIVEKIAKTGKVGKQKYPALLLVKENQPDATESFYRNYDGVQLLFVRALKPNNMTKADDFKLLHELKQEVFKQIAKDTNVFELRHDIPHTFVEKYLANQADFLAVLEVNLEEFLIKKSCNYV